MDSYKVLNQLEDLKKHCSVKTEGPADLWHDDVQALNIAMEKLKDLPPASKISPDKNASTKLYHNKTYFKIDGPVKGYFIPDNDLKDLQGFLANTLKDLCEYELKKAIQDLETLLNNMNERLGDR